LTPPAVPLTLSRMLSRYGLMRGLLFLVSGALFASCGSGGDGGGPGGENSPSCAKSIAKLRSCRLIPSGASLACFEDTSVETCENDCLTNESCSDLVGYYCSGIVDQAFKDCLTGCRRFTCKNGDTIWADSRCDGQSDCSDGSDEVDCASIGFQCKNGTTVKTRSRCNGFEDCQDGSDEDGCPTFTCKSGEKIPANQRCDTRENCRDDSDEDGCPPTLQELLTCP
jgi:hypothetical protein